MRRRPRHQPPYAVESVREIRPAPNVSIRLTSSGLSVLLPCNPCYEVVRCLTPLQRSAKQRQRIALSRAGRLCLTLSRLLGVITCRLAEFPMCFSACLPVIYTLFTCFFTVLYTHFTRLFKPI